jgi:hypothetical protein
MFAVVVSLNFLDSRSAIFRNVQSIDFLATTILNLDSHIKYSAITRRIIIKAIFKFYLILQVFIKHLIALNSIQIFIAPIMLFFQLSSFAACHVSKLFSAKGQHKLVSRAVWC